MPDRILRDEILKSRRWWSVSSQARDLWLGVFLSADDACRYTGELFDLRVRCMAGTVDEADVERLLGELVAVDLLRQYSNKAGARFLFIPRYRQRKRYVKASHYPTPPNEISDLTEDKTDSRLTQASSSPTQARLESVPSQTQDHIRAGVGVGVGVEVRRGEVGVGVGVRRGEDDYAGATSFFAAAQRLWLKGQPKTVLENSDPKPNGQPAGDWWITTAGIDAKGRELGMPARTYEPYRDYKDRLEAEIQRRELAGNQEAKP